MVATAFRLHGVRALGVGKDSLTMRMNKFVACMLLVIGAVGCPCARGQSAATFDFDATTGVLSLPGIVNGLRTDAVDRLVLQSGRVTRYLQPPWMDAGVNRTRLQMQSLISAAAAQGKSPSIVLLPTTGPIKWTWTSKRELTRIGADSRSAALRAVLGVTDLRAITRSPSLLSAATVALRSMVTRAVEQATMTTVTVSGKRIPVLIVERPTGYPSQNAAQTIAGILDGTVTALAVSPGAGSARNIATLAIADFRASLLAATPPPSTPPSGAPNSAGSEGTAPPSGSVPPVVVITTPPTVPPVVVITTPPTVPPVVAITTPPTSAQWTTGDQGWSATLADGTPFVSSWVAGIPAPQEDSMTRIRPTAQVQSVPGGLRVVLTYNNSTGLRRELASVALPAFQLGTAIRVQDTRDLGCTVELTPTSPVWRGTYPGILYAPACILRNETIAVGVSVEYPVMTYRHDIRLRCTGSTDGKWSVELGMENSTAHCGFSYLYNCPGLEPGEHREYVVNILTTNSADWVETLAPYRTYFRSQYGEVQYVRDLRPVFGAALSQLESMSDANPNGWIPSIGKPDLDGFEVAGSFLESRFRECSNRLMVWAPTGYSDNPKANYPFQFASRWTSEAALSNSDADNAPSTLRTIAATPGRTLGLWWGHSANPSYAWGEDPVRALRWSDPVMRETWMNELEAAVNAGATEIGLDAFVHGVSPVWELAACLRDAKLRFPNVRFCTEYRSSDLLHVMSATWTDCYRSTPLFNLPRIVARERFVIADYLVPGHETWVGMQFNLSQDPILWGNGSSRDAQRAAVANISALGYVPVTWVPMWLKQANENSVLAGATP